MCWIADLKKIVVLDRKEDQIRLEVDNDYFLQDEKISSHVKPTRTVCYALTNENFSFNKRYNFLVSPSNF